LGMVIEAVYQLIRLQFIGGAGSWL
jgi:hypothetical protein